ncbi:MAG: hypothetical protein ACOCXM_01780 [Myxococcota bacterium]
MRLSSAGVGLCALFLSLGCGESAPDGPPDPETRTLSATRPSVEPGVETTQCQVFDLGNEAPAMIRAIRTTLSAGSHHMIIDRTDEPVSTDPFPCGGIPGGADTLFIAQQAQSGVEYPDEAGLPIEAHQHIKVEIHYINFTGEPIDIEGTIDFDLVPVDPSIDPVEILFTGKLQLDIKSHQTTTVDSFHTVPSGGRIFGLTSHMHHLGEWATIQRASGVDDPAATLLHESNDWAEPPLDTFDPPLTLDEGEGLWLTCHYDNDTDTDVGFGPGYYDEMCFLWVYWY